MNNLCFQISSTLDQLVPLLDAVFKLPSDQRPYYLQHIDTHRNNLVRIKSNLRQTNVPDSDSQFKAQQVKIKLLKNQLLQNIQIHQTGFRPHQREAPPQQQNSMQFTNLIQTLNMRNKRSSKLDTDQYCILIESLTTKDQQLKSIKYKLSQIQRQSQTLRQKQLKSRKQLQQLRASEHTIRKENEFIKTKILKHEEEIPELKKLIIQQEDEIQRLSLNDRAHMNLCTSAATQIGDLNREISLLKEQLHRYRHICQTKSDQCDVLSRLLEDRSQRFQKELNLREDRQKMMSAHIAKLEPTAKECQIQGITILTLETELARLKADLQATQTQLSNSQRSSFQYKIQYEESKEKWENQTRGLKQIVKSLQNQISDKEQLVRLLQNNIQELTIAQRQKQNLLDSLQDQTRNKYELFYNAKEQIQNWKGDYQLVNEENSLLKTKYQQMFTILNEQTKRASEQFRGALLINAQSQKQIARMRAKLSGYQKQRQIFQVFQPNENSNKQLFYKGKIKAIRQIVQIIHQTV